MRARRGAGSGLGGGGASANAGAGLGREERGSSASIAAGGGGTGAGSGLAEPRKLSRRSSSSRRNFSRYSSLLGRRSRSPGRKPALMPAAAQFGFGSSSRFDCIAGFFSPVKGALGSLCDPPPLLSSGMRSSPCVLCLLVSSEWGRVKVDLNEDATYLHLIVVAQALEAARGNPAAMKEITDRIEGKISKPIEVSLPEGGPLDIQLLTHDQLDARIGKLLAECPSLCPERDRLCPAAKRER